jgi:membrane fusion protein (multidrug efflux system)
MKTINEEREYSESYDEERPVAAVAPAEPEKRRKWLFLLLRVFVVLLVIGAALYWWESRKYEKTDDAQIDGHIHPISSRIDGHVVKIHAEAGDFVKAGTVLVEIDSGDYRVAVERARAEYMHALATAEEAQLGVPISQAGSTSRIHTAEAAVLSAEAGVTAANSRVSEAEARLTQAQAGARTANLDLARYSELVEKKEISRQQFDQAEAAATSSNSEVAGATAALHSSREAVKQANARLAQARAELANARISPKEVAASQARARADEAAVAKYKALLDQAELNLGYTRIVAPTDGIVGNRTVQLGQNVEAGQELLAVVPLHQIWVTANFKETQLGLMRPGQKVEIKVDALGGEKFHGTVTSIGGATGARFSLLPPENATGSYVKVVQRIPVRIELDGHDGPGFNKDGRLRPGLSVVPSVRVR